MGPSHHQSNYETDLNLKRRRALMQCALAPPTPQPFVWDLFTWAPDARVLDLGCGDGIWAKVAADRTPAGSVVGLDLSMGMLAAAGSAAPSVERVNADGHVLPFASGSFDVVLALWCLYHLPNKAAVLGEIERVLRPKGMCIAVTNEAAGVGVVDDVLAASINTERAADQHGEPFVEGLDFTLANGADILGSVFEHVDTLVSETPFEVRERVFLHDYLLSIEGPVIEQTGISSDAFERVVADFDKRIDLMLADGPITFTRRVGLFRATR